MSREIKFRAWDSEEKIMVYDDENNSADYWDGAFASSVGMVSAQLKRQSEYVWMQYTGLKDKNGKEIYEGDIVRYHYFRTWDDERYVECNMWKQGEVVFKGVAWVLNESDEYKPQLQNVCIDEWEVIGNIYEKEATP